MFFNHTTVYRNDTLEDYTQVFTEQKSNGPTKTCFVHFVSTVCTGYVKYVGFKLHIILFTEPIGYTVVACSLKLIPS